MPDEISVYTLIMVDFESPVEAKGQKSRASKKTKEELQEKAASVEPNFVFGVVHSFLDDELFIYTGPESEEFWQRLESADRINGFGIREQIAVGLANDRSVRMLPKVNDIEERIIDELVRDMPGDVPLPDRFKRESVIRAMTEMDTSTDEAICSLWAAGLFGSAITQGQRVVREIATISSRIDTDGWVADATGTRHKLMAFKLVKRP